MSYNTSLGLDYFINNLNFTTSSSGSLVVSSQVVERILPGNHSSVTPGFTQATHSPAKLAQIAKALKKKVVLLELDFKQLRLTDHEGSKVFKHNWEQLFADQTFRRLIYNYNYSLEACVQAFLTAPVLATDAKSNVFNLKLCQYLTQVSLQSLHLPTDAVLVLSGEMVWSRWINTFMLTQLITTWFKTQNRSLIVDSYGVWQMLLHKPEAKLLELDLDYLEANFFYFGAKRREHFKRIELKAVADNQADKTLITTADRAAIFHLDHEYLYEDSVVRGDIYFAGHEMREFSAKIYSSWWPQLRFLQEELPEYRLQPELMLQTKSVEFDLSVDQLQIKQGQSILPGDTLGKVKQLSHHYQKMAETKTLPKMAMLAGQIVQAGDPLYYIEGKLLTKTVKSQFSGQVSFELLGQNLITITASQPPIELRAIFAGKVQSVSKKKARISAVALHIEAFKCVGTACQGELCTDIAHASPYPKLVAMTWDEFVSMPELEFIQNEVNAVILTGVNQLQFVAYAKQHTDLLTRLNLLIMDTFAEASAKLMNILEKFANSFCVLDSSGLSIVLSSQEQKQYLNMIAPQQSSALEQSKLICEIAYEQPMQYVRMDKTSTKLNLANAIFYG